MIGLGIITCDRIDFLKKCISSIPFGKIDHTILVNDGKDYITNWSPSGTKTVTAHIQHTDSPRQGVAVSKNQAIQYLIDQGCDHVFIIEDDITIVDDTVFEKYIQASKETGIQHFMFGYHGPANKSRSDGVPQYKYRFTEYGTPIVLNEHCVGAFCYYSKKCIQMCGLLDPRYHNAFEHIDHSHRIARAGLTTPYWNWADIHNSWKYLSEIACSEVNSSIRGQKNWQDNITNGFTLFKDLYGVTPFGSGCVPDKTKDEIHKIVKQIHEEHSYRH